MDVRRAQAAAAIGEAVASQGSAGFKSAGARTSLASNAKPFHTLLLLGLLERVPGCSPVGSVRPPTQGLGGGARCRAAASMAGGISGAGPAPTGCQRTLPGELGVLRLPALRFV